MKAGFGQACITPPIGMAMEGLGQQRGCKAIHDDLFVRALYLSEGEREALVLGYDLLFFEHDDMLRIKQALGRIGLKPDDILVNTSHNHAGPRMTRWAYSAGADRAYVERVFEVTLAAAAGAKAEARSVRVSGGMARTRLPVSRRKPDGRGGAAWAPYPEGAICDALPFCMFRDEAGELVSMLFSVSCHPSMIYECVITAEYPGVAVRHLNEHFQTKGAVFLQGAGGDTKPRHIAGHDQWRPGTWEEMEAAGAEVAQAVIKRADEGMTDFEPELKSCVIETEWPLKERPPRSLFESELSDPGQSAGRKAWAGDMLRLLDAGELSPVAVVSLHALQIGRGLRIIGIEGEAVGELGNLILDAYAAGVTFPLGYTDGCRLYLPVDRMLPEGGYEVDSYWEYHYPAPLAAGGEAVLAGTLRELKASGRMSE